MSRPAKPTVDRHGKPLPATRSSALPKVTLITDRVLEAPAEFVLESVAENPIKKSPKKKS